MLLIEYLALFPFFPYPHSSSLTIPSSVVSGYAHERDTTETERCRRRRGGESEEHKAAAAAAAAAAAYGVRCQATPREAVAAFRVRPPPRRRFPFADGSFSYFRLPADPLLRLSVLKLDGSSFDAQVARTARVRELKEAVECLFSRPSKDATTSWSHVWGHFCLCYNEHRLTDDKSYLRNFGIKDGDQLHFIRHLSFDHRPGKGRRPINHGTDMEQHRTSFTGSKVHDEVEETDKDRDHNGVGSTEYVDEKYALDDNDNQIRCTEFKFGHRFRGWFSYSRLRRLQNHGAGSFQT